MTTYWHGGRPGIRRFGMILPSMFTGVLSLAECGAAGVCRRDKVYVTTDFNAALMYAASVDDGVVYQCDPVGPIEPDPDCNAPGLSFQCARAKVLKVIRPDREVLREVQLALLGEHP